MTPAATWPRPRDLPPADVRLCVVEASAGTGKTFFLEHRVADLILAGASIDQLLVVTFTEKATAELRQRLRGLLERMATAPAEAPSGPDAGPSWRLDDEARARLRQAVSQFDRAAVHTIHAFCQRLLVEDAFTGKRLFEQTQIPDQAAFEDAFLHELRTRFTVEPDHRALLAEALRGKELKLPARRAWSAASNGSR